MKVSFDSSATPRQNDAIDKGRPQFLVSSDVFSVPTEANSLFRAVTVAENQVNTRALIEQPNSTFQLYQSSAGSDASQQQVFAEFLLRLASEASFDTGGLTSGEHIIAPPLSISLDANNLKVLQDLLGNRIDNIGTVTVPLTQTFPVVYAVLGIDVNAARRGSYPFMYAGYFPSSGGFKSAAQSVLEVLSKKLTTPQFKSAYASMETEHDAALESDVKNGFAIRMQSGGSLAQQLHYYTMRVASRRTALWYEAMRLGQLGADSPVTKAALHIDRDFIAAIKASVPGPTYPGMSTISSPFDRHTTCDPKASEAPLVPSYIKDMTLSANLDAILSKRQNLRRASGIFSSSLQDPPASGVVHSEVLYAFAQPAIESADLPPLDPNFFYEPEVARPEHDKAITRTVSEEEEETIVLDPSVSPDVPYDGDVSDDEDDDPMMEDTDSEDDIDGYLLSYIESGAALEWEGADDNDTDDDDSDGDGDYWFTDAERLKDPTYREDLRDEIYTAQNMLAEYPTSSEAFLNRARAIAAARMILDSDGLRSTQNEEIVHILHAGALAAAAQMDYVASEARRKRRRSSRRRSKSKSGTGSRRSKSKSGTGGRRSKSKSGTGSRRSKSKSGTGGRRSKSKSGTGGRRSKSKSGTGDANGKKRQSKSKAGTDGKKKTAGTATAKKDTGAGEGGKLRRANAKPIQRQRGTAKPLPTPPARKTAPARPSTPAPKTPPARKGQPPARPKSPAPRSPPKLTKPTKPTKPDKSPAQTKPSKPTTGDSKRPSRRKTPADTDASKEPAGPRQKENAETPTNGDGGKKTADREKRRKDRDRRRQRRETEKRTREKRNLRDRKKEERRLRKQQQPPLQPQQQGQEQPLQQQQAPLPQQTTGTTRNTFIIPSPLPPPRPQRFRRDRVPRQRFNEFDDFDGVVDEEEFDDDIEAVDNGEFGSFENDDVEAPVRSVESQPLDIEDGDLDADFGREEEEAVTADREEEEEVVVDDQEEEVVTGDQEEEEEEEDVTQQTEIDDESLDAECADERNDVEFADEQEEVVDESPDEPMNDEQETEQQAFDNLRDAALSDVDEEPEPSGTGDFFAAPVEDEEFLDESPSDNAPSFFPPVIESKKKIQKNAFDIFGLFA